MVTLTKHVIPGPDLHCAGPLALKVFSTSSCQIYAKTKKVLLSKRWALGLWHTANTALVIALCS